MELRRVVVTGLGALTPIGNNIQEFWNGLINGISGAAPITYFDASKFKTQFACELKGFNVEDFIDRKEARKMDRYAQYAMVSSEEAVKDANFDFEKLDYNNKTIWFDVLESEFGKYILIQKKKKVNGEWVHEHSITLPLALGDRFIKALDKILHSERVKKLLDKDNSGEKSS